MTFGESIRSGLSQYATFRGRAARSEYWWFYLFYLICLVGAIAIDRTLGTSFVQRNPFTGLIQPSFTGWFYLVVVLGLFLPNLAVIVRRLHDTDHSGWWFWIVLVPLIGAILLIVWFCSRGTRGTNKYGFDPLSEGLADTFR